MAMVSMMRSITVLQSRIQIKPTVMAMALAMRVITTKTMMVFSMT